MHARALDRAPKMSFVLTLCLMASGGCEQPAIDPIDMIEAIVIEETDDPVERWRPLIATQFPEEELDTAMCIIRHESNGDPSADNPRSTARGLFQVLGSLWAPKYEVPQTALYDPVTNTRMAAGIWEDQGWMAWSPYQRGLCRY